MTRCRPEAQIQLGIKTFMKLMGFAVYDLSQPRATMQTAGLSDLIAFGHNHILFIEVKTPKGRLTAYQQVFREEVLANGGVFLVWRSTKDAWDWLAREGIIEEAE